MITSAEERQDLTSVQNLFHAQVNLQELLAQVTILVFIINH